MPYPPSCIILATTDKAAIFNRLFTHHETKKTANKYIANGKIAGHQKKEATIMANVPMIKHAGNQ